MRMIDEIAIDGLGGLAGALAMFTVFTLGKKVGFVRTPMPEVIEKRLEARAGIDTKTTPEQKIILAYALHAILGVAWGAGYTFARRAVKIPEYLLGPLYGLGTYAFDDFIAGPALRLTPDPAQESSQMIVRRILIHILYGITLGLVSDQLRKRAL